MALSRFGIKPILSRLVAGSVRRHIVHRNVMSKAFLCESAWEQRLSSPVFQRTDTSKFFLEVERKLQKENRANAVDIDIFANLAASEMEVDQLEELLHLYRRTPTTFLTLESTPHAVVRAFVKEGKTDNLMRVISDRLNYGIFPDNYTIVFLLNHFIEAGNWRDASKVGIHLMLQEDLDVAVAREMSLYACFKFSRDWKPEPWNPQEAPKAEEPEEDVKVRLEYLKPDYFDDHFDLVKMEHLVGKTLARMSSKLEGDLYRSLELLGWALFEKWDKVKHLLGHSSTTFAKISIDSVKELVQSAETCKDKEQLVALLDKAKCDDVDVEDALKSAMLKSAKEHEQTYISQQTESFARWNSLRESELEKQYQIYLREARKEEILRKRKEIAEKEEKLFFYEREDEFAKRKEEKLQEWMSKMPKRTWKGGIKLKPKEKVSDNYIPPNIR